MSEKQRAPFGRGAIALAALILLAACGTPPDSRSQTLSGDNAPPPSSPTRCPSPVGLEEPGPDATADGLGALSAIRVVRPEQLFALTDPALWPTVRQGPLNLPAREYRASEVTSGPARDSTVAKQITAACGRRVLEASWWIALCPDASTTCVRDRPSSATDLLFVRRHGEALLWWIR